MSGSFSLRADELANGTAVLVDLSCGTCAHCAAGSTLWCSAPTAEGRRCGPEMSRGAVTLVRAAVLGVAALMRAPVASTVVVEARLASPTIVLAQRVLDAFVVPAPVLAAPEVRAWVAAREPTGRAQVILAGLDLRTAVRAVRRGGHVCVPTVTADDCTTRPSVTEIVQREVTLVSPRRATDVLERLTGPDWAAVIAAA